jgi:hypothetical protein
VQRRRLLSPEQHSPINQLGSNLGMRQLWLSRLADTYTDLGAIVHDDQGHDLSYHKS